VVERTREPGRQRRPTRPPEAPRPAEHPLLALQARAGNAAVAAMLGRRRNLPEHADELEEVSAAAKDMKIETAVLTIDEDRWVGAARGTERGGYAVDIKFHGNMAGPDPEGDAEKKVTGALRAIGMSIFNLSDGATDPPAIDVVRFADLDFTKHGGVAGHYRFTSVLRAPKARGRDAKVDLIVELVRLQRPEFKPWSKLTADERRALENRFASFKFTKVGPDALGQRVAMTWLDDQWGQVLQALSRLPDATLRAIPDMDWERGRGRQGPGGEYGEYTYDPRTKQRVLTLFDGAFADGDEALVTLIAHEIGHAMSFRPTEGTPRRASGASSPAFRDALRADGGKALTDYGATNAEEHYAEAYSMFIAEPETLKVLRPNVFAFFTANPTGIAPPPPPRPAARPRAGRGDGRGGR
jgi:hypothetical protein